MLERGDGKLTVQLRFGTSKEHVCRGDLTGLTWSSDLRPRAEPFHLFCWSGGGLDGGVDWTGTGWASMKVSDRYRVDIGDDCRRLTLHR